MYQPDIITQRFTLKPPTFLSRHGVLRLYGDVCRERYYVHPNACDFAAHGTSQASGSAIIMTTTHASSVAINTALRIVGNLIAPNMFTNKQVDGRIAPKQSQLLLIVPQK